MSNLQPAEPVVRYEHEAPGDMLHIDTKKLGCIVRPSHRVTGHRKDSFTGSGWEMLFVAIDNHARIAFIDIHPDVKTPNAVQFLRNAHAYCASLGVRIQRLLTDNGSAFRSRDFARACQELGAGRPPPVHAPLPASDQRQGRTLHTLGSREWAYGLTYQNSAERTCALDY